MRKQLFVPMLVGMLALGAVQAFAQSATVVMRNGDRVRADVIDMGAQFHVERERPGRGRCRSATSCSSTSPATDAT